MNDVVLPPRGDEEPRPSILRQSGVEGQITRDAMERERRTLRQSFTDGVMSTVFARGARAVRQRVDTEAPWYEQAGQFGAAITGQGGKWGEGDWDRDGNFDGLVTDIPRDYWENILGQNTLEGAQMVRGNIMADMERMRRIGLDRGTADLMSMGGMLFDVDAPLVLLSGGGFGAARTAGWASYQASRAGLQGTTAMRLAGAATGLSVGGQAGALLGLGEMAHGETSTWMDGVIVGLGSVALGGALGTIAPSMTVPAQGLAEDFERRVRAGDPTLWEAPQPVVSDMVPESSGLGPVTIDLGEEVGDGTVPAWNPSGQGLSADVAPSGRFPKLVDPAVGFSPAQVQIVQQARTRVDQMDFDMQTRAAMDNMWDRLGASRWATLPSGTDNVSSMWRSQSSVLNWMVGDIFEVPSGVIRGASDNAAQLREMYTRRIASHVAQAEMPLIEYAKARGQSAVNLGGLPIGASADITRQFYRDVYLHMNDVSLGRTPRNTDPHVRQAAEMYGNAGMESLAIMRGRAGELPVDGAAGLPSRSMYFPYRHNGAKIMQMLNEGVKHSDIVAAYRDGYLRARTVTDPDLAEKMAEALVTRFTVRGARVDENMVSLFSGDGRNYLRRQFESMGLPQAEVNSLMRRFEQQMEERGKLSALKHRNELDLSVEIPNSGGRRLVDMMRSDLQNVYTGYAREIGGQAALARKGITNKAMIDDVIAAAQAEQRALGETPMSPEVLRAMFSEFDGGPQWGVMAGVTNKGMGALSEIKALTSLSVLTFNGAAQLAETGVAVFAVGASNWFNRGIGRMFDDAIKTSNKTMLDDLSFMMGRIGEDQRVLRPHLNLDDTDSFIIGDSMIHNVWRKSRELIGAGNFIQGYTSFLNIVRKEQQQVAVLGMSDKIFRAIREGRFDDFEFRARTYRDLGLNLDHAERLQELVNNGTIEFTTSNSTLGPHTYVNRLNLAQWPEYLAQEFTSALNRSMNQIVQRGVAGETDRWMHSGMGSMLTHLKTFPMLAVQKQFIRNMAQQDTQAVATALSGFATAYAALGLRDAFTGRDRDSFELAKAAFGYSNITGWIPMVSDPIVSALGMPELRVNQFGPYAKPFEVPALDVFNNLWRAPGAAQRVLRDEDDWTDRQSIRAIPFVRLIESMTRLGGVSLD